MRQSIVAIRRNESLKLVFLTVTWRGFTLEYVVNKINIQFLKRKGADLSQNLGSWVS